MGYDDVILHLGDFGRYQQRIYFLLCLTCISCAFNKMGGVFLTAKSDFRCLLPQEDRENANFSIPPEVTNSSYPLDHKTGSWSRCERYYTDFIDQYNTSDAIIASSQLHTEKCDDFVYDKTDFALTVTTEWNLVCSNAWLRATSDSLFMVGMMMGSIIFGELSDRYGRKPTFFFGWIVQSAAGILIAISPEIVSFMTFRMILGATTNGLYIVGFVIVIEMVGSKKRLLAATGCHLFFALGYILVAGLAYYITNWRNLQIAFTVPSIFFLSYWWFIPESARWLLTKGRLHEAKRLLKKSFLENGVEVSDDKLDNLLSIDSESIKPDAKEPSMFDLVRYPNLRNKNLVLFFTWFVASSTYYGLSWNTSNLGGNNYVNFVIAAAVEVPAHLFLLLTLDKWGRKILVCGCMILAGMSLVCTIFVPADIPWLVVFLSMFGKLAITASYGAVYVFTVEQYPTAIRNVGLGACSTSSKIGGIMAPFINHLAELWAPLPLVIFGSCSLISGLLSLLLPETLNAKLPESIEDGERFGKNIERDIETWNDADIIKPLTELENGVCGDENG